MHQLVRTGQVYQEWAKVYRKDYPKQAMMTPSRTTLYMAIGEDQKFYVAYRVKNGPLEVVGRW